MPNFKEMLMDNNLNLNVDSTAITSLTKVNQTQLIFQRHCNYDRANDTLMEDSTHHQEEVVKSFIDSLPLDNLNKTYILFTASNTTSNINFKRCIETTNIAMELIKEFFKKNNIPVNHIINLDENANYKNSIHESKSLTEPQMFTDNTGYLEFLKTKHNGINKDFWIDFEEDLSKDKREMLNAEGPDQIVDRTMHYIAALQKYSSLFHLKHPNSKLIIWNGTHYDLISPLVKQKILNWEKSAIVSVEYCGGLSFILDEFNQIVANVNGITYPFDFQYNQQPHRHF